MGVIRRIEAWGIGAALVLLMLLLSPVERALGSPAWPQLGCDPIPPERIPETIPPGAEARCDSIRSALDALFAARSLPAPPDHPAPRLVAWMTAILMFPLPGEVEAFGEAAPPETWSRADSSGVLPLAAALALHEIGRDTAALAWCGSRDANAGDRPYLDLLAIELRDAIGDSAGAVEAAERVAASAPKGDPIFRPAAVKILDAFGKDPAGLLRESLRIRRSLGAGGEETAARYTALVTLRPASAAAVGDTLIRLYPATRSARTEALRRLHEKGRRIASVERNLLFDALMRQRLFAQADTLLRRFPSDSLRVARLEGLLASRQYDAILSDRTVKSTRWSRALLGRWHLVHARAARNSGRIPEMERRYAAAALLGGTTRETALSEWAREAESASRDRQADSLYTLLARIPGSAEEAHFRRGIARVVLGRLKGAEADFALLRKGPFSAGAEFWLARLAQTRKDTTAERAALARAASNPGGYYARRARAELDRRAAGMHPGAFWETERAALFRPRTTPAEGGKAVNCTPERITGIAGDRIRLLRRFAREEWAEREESFLSARMPADRRAERFFCLGLPDLAIRIAVSGLSGAPTSFRYPRPYAAWIPEAAAAASLAPEFVWAIARRESLFDPGARSTAGARGLLQLMDETALETSRKFGLAPGPLERGDRNLDLGTRHLRDLREEHDWPVPAIIAAYNAGSSKTEEWVSRSSDPDLFIERIGWRETRDYVKGVLEACWIYRDSLDGRIE